MLEWEISSAAGIHHSDFGDFCEVALASRMGDVGIELKKAAKDGNRATATMAESSFQGLKPSVCRQWYAVYPPCLLISEEYRRLRHVLNLSHAAEEMRLTGISHELQGGLQIASHLSRGRPCYQQIDYVPQHSYIPADRRS